VAVLKRDYYDVLGVSREADDDEIQRAFHAQAREWHPDVAEAPDAEARFRELAEAYTVLSKHESRVLYDRYGYRGRGNHGFDEALWEARRPEIVRGDNIHTELEVRSFEAEEGTRRLISFHAIVRCPACGGRGSITFPESAEEPCSRCDGRGTVETERRIRLRIPAGVEDGAQLRVSGDGNDAGAGSVPGDLLVRLHVLPPPKDPRAVRFIAFALLLVAIAALAVYVIR
jgi:molecular chaperone DnaJ